jgi:[ribosomal protein S5]-alanine N-acetyltransferase
MGEHEGAGAAGLAEGSSRVTLRPLSADDQDEFLMLARASVSLHHPWYSVPTTVEEFRAYLTRFAQPGREGLVVCVRGSGAMAGLFTIDNIVRGRFQSASLSYAAFAPAAGQGYMSEGLGLVLRYAFQQLRLHRVEASIQPGNEASLRLVRRHGFGKEGFSPRMLFIDGSWRDHERWAITMEMTGLPPVDPHPTRPGRLSRRSFGAGGRRPPHRGEDGGAVGQRRERRGLEAEVLIQRDVGRLTRFQVGGLAGLVTALQARSDQDARDAAALVSGIDADGVQVPVWLAGVNAGHRPVQGGTGPEAAAEGIGVGRQRTQLRRGARKPVTGRHPDRAADDLVPGAGDLNRLVRQRLDAQYHGK